MLVGGVVLTGGKSRRMGQPKEWLPILGEPMLCRVVRQISEVVRPIVVVAAVGQRLPALPDEVLIACDEQPDCGPLEGLRAGLRELAQQSPSPLDAVLVVSCDLPLVSPAFIRCVIRALEADGSADAAVPHDGQRLHPLAAVYRLSVLATIERRLAAGQRRMLDLCAAVQTRQVPDWMLREVDGDLASLVNVNCPEDFARVRHLVEPPLGPT